MMKKMLLALLLLQSLLFSAVQAQSIGDDLQHYFKSLNQGVNVTAAHAYQNQRAGFYTGGNLYARNSVRNLQLMRVNLPKISAGCGGIDAYFGGFSHIKGAEFVDFLKNILNNSQGLAFQLALEQATPLIGNVSTKLQNVATWINQTSLQSCPMTESAVLGLWPRTRQAQQHTCQQLGQAKNIFSDWAEARQGCGKGGSQYNYERVMNENSADETVIDNKNVVWSALNNNGLFARDQELKELMMSLSGSLIVTRDQDGMHVQRLPSLVGRHEVINALLHGGEVKLYQCDESVNCLKPALISKTIDAGHGLESKVQALLLEMAAHIQDNKELPPEIKGLIEATHLPVMKMVSVQLAFMKNSAALDVTRYSQAIAIDILMQYLNENLQLIKEAVHTLQYPEAVMTAIQKDLTRARQEVSQLAQSAHQRMSMAMQLIEETQTIEQMLVGELSANLTQSLTWANQLR